MGPAIREIDRGRLGPRHSRTGPRSAIRCGGRNRRGRTAAENVRHPSSACAINNCTTPRCGNGEQSPEEDCEHSATLRRGKAPIAISSTTTLQTAVATEPRQLPDDKNAGDGAGGYRQAGEKVFIGVVGLPSRRVTLDTARWPAHAAQSPASVPTSWCVARCRTAANRCPPAIATQPRISKYHRAPNPIQASPATAAPSGTNCQASTGRPEPRHFPRITHWRQVSH